jgi:hypothetical protein
VGILKLAAMIQLLYKTRRISVLSKCFFEINNAIL